MDEFGKAFAFDKKKMYVAREHWRANVKLQYLLSIESERLCSVFGALGSSYRLSAKQVKLF